MKKLSRVLLMMTSFVFLTGSYGRCGRELTVEEKKQRIEKYSKSMVEDVTDDLDATDAQTADAERIRERVMKQGLPMLGAHEEAKVFYKAQWQSSNPDRARVHEVVEARGEDMKKLFHVAADALIDFHQILTPKQRKEVEEMWD